MQTSEHKIQQNNANLVQSPLATFGHETRWAYSTMLPSPDGIIAQRWPKGVMGSCIVHWCH